MFKEASGDKEFSSCWGNIVEQQGFRITSQNTGRRVVGTSGVDYIFKLSGETYKFLWRSEGRNTAISNLRALHDFTVVESARQ